VRIIGITGGVGAGKSEILKYIKENYNTRIILADQVANDLKEPGERCYEPLVSLLSEAVLLEDGRIDKGKMAQMIFQDKALLEKVNQLIHPAVKQFILEEIEKESALGKVDYFFIEAALLIEDHYDEIVDELWYIYAREDVRRIRLKESRGYSDEKIAAIMAGQLSEDEFLSNCHFRIDNSDTLEKAYLQIQHRMED